MDLLAIFAALQQAIVDLQAKLAEAQAALEVEKKTSFDAGFAAGVASVSPGNDKVFSQAELEAAVAQAKAELQLVVDGLLAEIAPLKDQLAQIPALIEAGKVEAVLALKAELKAKYEEAQLAEKSAEDAFASLLA